jgi:hypothetical protein
MTFTKQYVIKEDDNNNFLGNIKRHMDHLPLFSIDRSTIKIIPGEVT